MRLLFLAMVLGVTAFAGGPSVEITRSLVLGGYETVRLDCGDDTCRVRRERNGNALAAQTIPVAQAKRAVGRFFGEAGPGSDAQATRQPLLTWSVRDGIRENRGAESKQSAATSDRVGAVLALEMDLLSQLISRR